MTRRKQTQKIVDQKKRKQSLQGALLAIPRMIWKVGTVMHTCVDINQVSQPNALISTLNLNPKSSTLNPNPIPNPRPSPLTLTQTLTLTLTLKP